MREGLPSLPRNAVRALVAVALAEDAPWGDITSDTLVPFHVQARGQLVAREPGTVCGLPVARAAFEEADPSVTFRECVAEGTRVDRGSVAAEVWGNARSLLTAERTALNFLQRMSGIATTTATYVDAVRGTTATIIDTRKTVPGLRLLDKYAVRCGGGSNHRFSLSDGVLVKDNHLAALGERSVAAALRSMRQNLPHTVKIEVEVDRLDQIEAALDGGADILLLDNMSPEMMREAVQRIGGRALTEASGGIALKTVRAVAEAGVNLISIGALTHSVHALDIGLDLELQP